MKIIGGIRNMRIYGREDSELEKVIPYFFFKNRYI